MSNPNTPAGDFLWDIVFTNSSKTAFFLKARWDNRRVLSRVINSNSLAIAIFNAKDIKQQWTFKSSPIVCPNNCNGNGVCSYSTGFLLLFNMI